MNNSGEINRLSVTPNIKPQLPPPRPVTGNFRGRGIGMGAPSSSRPILPPPNLPPCPLAKPLPTSNISTAQAPNKPTEQPPSPPKPLPQVPPFRNTNNQNAASESTIIIIPNKVPLQPAVNTAELIAKAEGYIDKAAKVGFKDYGLAWVLLDQAGDLYLKAASDEKNKFDYLKIATCLYRMAQNYLTQLGQTISKEFEVLEQKRYPTMRQAQDFDQNWREDSSIEFKNLEQRAWLIDNTKVKSKKESKFSKIGSQLKKNSSGLFKGASKKIDSVSKTAQKNLSAAFATPLSIDQKATQLANSATQAEQEGRLPEAFHLRHQIAKLYAEHKGMLDESNPSITQCLSDAITWYDSLIPQIHHLSAQEQENMRALIAQQTEKVRAELKTRPDVAFDISYLESEVKKDFQNAQHILARMVNIGTLLDEGRVSILMSYYYLYYRCPSYYDRFKNLANSNSNNEFFKYWNNKRSDEFNEQFQMQVQDFFVTLNKNGEIDLPSEELESLDQIPGHSLIHDYVKFKEDMGNLFIRKYTELHIDHSRKKMCSFESRLPVFEAALLQSAYRCYLKDNFVYAYLYLEMIVEKCLVFHTSRHSSEIAFNQAYRRMDMATEYLGYLQQLSAHFIGNYQALRQEKIRRVLEEIPKSRTKIADDYEERAEQIKKEQADKETNEARCKEIARENQAMRERHAANMANIYASMPKAVCYTGNSVYGLANGGMGGVRWI